MKSMKRVLAFVLTMALSTSLFAGCAREAGSTLPAGQNADISQKEASPAEAGEAEDLSGITDPFMAVSGIAGDAVAARVGSYEITVAELLYWLNGQIESYLTRFQSMGYSFTEIPWDADTDGVTMEETVLNSALETAAFYRLLPALGEEAGLVLNQEEIDFPAMDLEMSAKELGGQETLTHWLWFRMMDEDLYTQLYHGGCMFEKLQDHYYGQGSEGYPSDADVKKYAEGELGYYRVKHILLKTAERTIGEAGTMTYEALPEEVTAEKRVLAEEILRQLAQAEDLTGTFDALMHAHSEDPGLSSAPDGYQVYPGQMVTPFEEASLALEEGEVSGIVESDDGYHIILRLPLDLEPFRGQMISQSMDRQIMGWLEEYGIETTEIYEEVDPSEVRARFERLQSAVRGELEAALTVRKERSEDNDPKES